MTEIRRRARGAILPVFCLATMAWFGYHAAEGERGLPAYSRLTEDIRDAKVSLADLSQERRRLERRVQLLRVDGLDLDMLEEQSRRQLGLIMDGEAVILSK